jgi:hypothetical protein
MERNQLAYLPRSIGNLIQLQTLNVKGGRPESPVHVTFGQLQAIPGRTHAVLCLEATKHRGDARNRLTSCWIRVSPW